MFRLPRTFVVFVVVVFIIVVFNFFSCLVVYIPAYQDEKSLHLIYDELKRIFSKKLQNYNHEIIFIND